MGKNFLQLNSAKIEWLCVFEPHKSRDIRVLTLDMVHLPQIGLQFGGPSGHSSPDHCGQENFCPISFRASVVPFSKLGSSSVTPGNSRLYYCNALKMKLPLKTTYKFQLNQNTAVWQLWACLSIVCSCNSSPLQLIISSFPSMIQGAFCHL